MADILKTYSVLIKWADNDDEQGNYGTVVRATSYEDAEEKARADMRENHIANNCDADDDADEIAESCSAYEHTDFKGHVIFGGECQECTEGAIWKAAELEAALRALKVVAVCDEDTDRVAFDAAMKLADAVIADIDGIA